MMNFNARGFAIDARSLAYMDDDLYSEIVRMAIEEVTDPVGRPAIPDLPWPDEDERSGSHSYRVTINLRGGAR